MRREGDVVGVDGPLCAGDSAAEVVPDRRQRQVDRVGVDQADEESEVGRDQGQNVVSRVNLFVSISAR